MADDEKKKKKKGTFTNLRLDVTKKYVFPASRAKMVIVGLAAVGLILAYTGFDSLFHHNGFISQGPISSKHSAFESNCANCHLQTGSLVPLGTVTNDKCSVCHEKFGDKLGVYSYGSHFVFRSGDLTRNRSRDHEDACFSCHVEHKGRNANIALVSDARCIVCHQYGSFTDTHPQFEFLRSQVPDPAHLKFPHVKHVIEVKKHEALEDNERACLYCHNALPDGKGFQPISFDKHCSGCHLKGEDETPPLRVKSSANVPGVEMLNMIRKRKGPTSQGMASLSENEFREAGGQVIKHPVRHEDPWIMENLRLLREEIFPESGLAGLLNASADVPNKDVRVLYQEALNTLKEYAGGLRSRPESQVQNELSRIDVELKEIERALNDPYTPFDRSKFLPVEANPRININEFQAVVDGLTSTCRRCHLVENATIVRVQKDQRVLRRAEFNHRAHILQRGCLDCHYRIPIREALDNPSAIDASKDVASVQDIPGIETCQQCHRAEGASNRCITCHYFHPNKTQRSNLLVYVH